MESENLRVVCLRFVPKCEATLNGIADLTLQVHLGAWLMIRNCTYYKLPTGKQWVQWPMIRYEGGRYANVLDWSHSDAAAAFQTAALRAIAEQVAATRTQTVEVANG